MILVGRSRELQGLAAAIVKLWAKSAIAKIAIKRGVLNTCNERMAEELKVRSEPDDMMSWESYKVFLLSESNLVHPSSYVNVSSLCVIH